MRHSHKQMERAVEKASRIIMDLEAEKEALLWKINKILVDEGVEKERLQRELRHTRYCLEQVTSDEDNFQEASDKKAFERAMYCLQNYNPDECVTPENWEDWGGRDADGNEDKVE